MYPPNNYSGYPPADYEASRSMGRGPDRRSSLNNPSVGEGPMSDRMPMAPGGFDAPGGFGPPGGFGGPGGFAEPGGFMVPSPTSGGFGNPPYPPASGGGYPPANGGYPPAGGGYPPASGGYPPASGGYPPPGGARPPMGGYPPQSPYGDSGYPPRPPPRNQRPPMSAGPHMAGCSSSSLQPPPRPDQQMHQSAPNLSPNRPPRPDQPRPQSQQNQGGPRPSSFVSSAPTNNPPRPTETRGMHWFQVNQQNTMIPASAVQAGKYGNDPVFIGRAPHKGSMQVGMVTMSKEGLVITYDGKPLLFREYEVLCGPSGKYKWMPVHGRFDPKDIKGCRPFICGHEKSGDSLYAATTELHGRSYAGKVTKGKHMLYSHKGKEDKTKDYSVLCEI